MIHIVLLNSFTNNLFQPIIYSLNTVFESWDITNHKLKQTQYKYNIFTKDSKNDVKIIE